MRKTIKVTAEDIRRGERRSYCECPVALAARRAFRARYDRKVVVRHEGIFIGDVLDDRLWVGTVDAKLSDFLKKFDRGSTVQPTAFEIEFA